MQKVVYHFLFVLFLLELAGCFSAQSRHLQEIVRQYPFGLIGNDYGILSADDLAINTCNMVEVESFPPKNASPYPYWKCYWVKDASIICDDSGFDEDEKSIMSILDLTVRSPEGTDSYLTRRAIRIESCQYFQKELERLAKNEAHICISGEFWRYDHENRIGIWSFDKFKTAKGCVSYFDGECDLAKKVEKGCKPLKKSGN